MEGVVYLILSANIQVMFSKLSTSGAREILIALRRGPEGTKSSASLAQCSFQ